MDKNIVLKEEIRRLRAENKYYLDLLISNKIEYTPYQQFISNKLSTNDKLQLYMDYFKGRTDVYAKRWESKGKIGYSPVCKNKFINGICEWSKYKCLNCPNQIFDTLSIDIIKSHIMGKHVIGLYPMLDNDNCYLVALDFDEGDWKKEAILFKEECQKYNIDCLVEISRSGNGAHIWVFFEDQIEASKARKVMSYILTSVMNDNGIISFKAYDRMFPSQDKLLKNGIGNLIALPLQGSLGALKRTVFVNNDFIPFGNQFQAIQNTKKVKLELMNNLYNQVIKIQETGNFGENIKKDTITKEDFKNDLRIIRKSDIVIAKDNLSSKSLRYLMRMASFLNKKYFEHQAKRLSVYNIPRIITLYREDENFLSLPRGCFEQLTELLSTNKIDYQIVDNRNKGTKINVRFNGSLKNDQMNALDHILKFDNGIFVAPTGFGKTVIASALIAKRKVNTLILVNNINLCSQWEDSINNFLINDNTSKSEQFIGVIHSNNKRITNIIDIALIQSLSSNEDLQYLFDNYGMIICDEAHHIAAASYEKVIRSITSKYVYGLTATPKRSDGYEKINYLAIGNIIYTHNNQNNVTSFKKILSPHFTSFKIRKEDKLLNISEIYSKLCNDETRNMKIINDIINSYRNDKHILVLTNRVEHAKWFKTELSKTIENVILIYGKMAMQEKNNFNAEINRFKTSNFIIVSTGKFIGEGFDNIKLDTLFLTTPFKWKGTLSQYVGRLHRESEQKHIVEVHDYIDINIKMFSNMYNERQKGYKELGYSISTEIDTESFFYDSMTYQNKLNDDLINAKNNVIFIIDYMHIDKVKILISKIKVLVEAFIADNIDNFSISKVTILSEIGINMIIIDDNIIWYGGINPFIFKNNELSIMRLVDKSLAMDILINLKSK